MQRESLGRTHVSLKTRENVNERPNAFRWKARQRQEKLELWWEYFNFSFFLLLFLLLFIASFFSLVYISRLK